jgi:antitoxin component YwqK of YwqJK toxin-antitoxin module
MNRKGSARHCIFTVKMYYMRMPRTLLLFCLFIACSGAAAQTVDASGRKQGYWKKKDDKTGKLIYEGEFRDDKPVGKFRYYYPNDSVRAVLTFRKNSTASYARLFHSNGKRMGEGKYLDKDIKDSTWTYYDESGTLLSREIYVKGKKEGQSFVYFPDGTISEEKNWKAGSEEGVYKQYFEGRKVKAQGSYKAGKLEGRSVHLYPNGVEAAAGYYRNGLKNGPWIYRGTNGRVTEKELYKDGQLATPEETTKFFEKNKVIDSKPPAPPAPSKKPRK